MLTAPRKPYASPTASLAELARLHNEHVNALANALRRVFGNASLDDVYLQGVALATLANTVVNHKLGRVPQEWRVVRITGASTIYEVARSSTTLTLYSSGAVTVDLRIS